MNHATCTQRFRLDPYVDGALDAVQTLETEAHIDTCACCRESSQFLSALKGAVKKSADLEVSVDFAERMMASAKARVVVRPILGAVVGAEAADVALEAAKLQVNPGGARAGGRTGTAVVTAASMLALAAGAVLFVNVRRAEAERLNASQTLGEFLAEHRSPMPIDTERVHELERYVGIPVRAPFMHGNGHMLHMRLMGGRVLPVMASRAAMLQYQVERSMPSNNAVSSSNETSRLPAAVPGRVSVFIYDPAKIRVDDATFEDRRVGEAQVRVGRSSGYSVAVTQRAGVGYAVATDLGTDDTAQMAGLFE